MNRAFGGGSPLGLDFRTRTLTLVLEARMKRPEAKTTVSVRVDRKLVTRFEGFVVHYNTAHFKPGFSEGPPQALTLPSAFRWAMEVGLTSLEKHVNQVSPVKKGGSK
jgi:hypothetical protein